MSPGRRWAGWSLILMRALFIQAGLQPTRVSHAKGSTDSQIASILAALFLAASLALARRSSTFFNFYFITSGASLVDAGRGRALPTRDTHCEL